MGPQRKAESACLSSTTHLPSGTVDPPPPQAYKQNKPNDQTNREFPTAWVEDSECEVLFIPCLGARSLERNMHGAIPYHAGREAFERCRSAHIPPSFN